MIDTGTFEQTEDAYLYPTAVTVALTPRIQWRDLFAFLLLLILTFPAVPDRSCVKGPFGCLGFKARARVVQY